MAAGYRLLAFWVARAGRANRATGGDRSARITTIYRPVANIINFD